MTISDIYVRLYSRPYYEKNEHHKFRFMNNSLCIDRRAIVPIVIHMLDGIFYMQAMRQIENKSLFRLEMNEDDITLYSIENDYPLWILE